MPSDQASSQLEGSRRRCSSLRGRPPQHRCDVVAAHRRNRVRSSPEVGRTNEFQFGIKNAHLLVGTLAENRMNIGGVDGTRTRDPRRDRPVF